MGVERLKLGQDLQILNIVVQREIELLERVGKTSELQRVRRPGHQCPVAKPQLGPLATDTTSHFDIESK